MRAVGARLLLEEAAGRVRGYLMETHGLTARTDGREHVFRRPGEQDEHHVGRRLLEGLEKRVGGGLREQVRAVEDVDLRRASDRRELRVAHDLADLVDRVAADSPRRDEAHVGVRAMRHPDAVVACAASAVRAEYGGGEREGGLGLSAARRPDEQIGVRHLSARYGALEKGTHLRLSRKRGVSDVRGAHARSPR